jgi:hypothetical protein
LLGFDSSPSPFNVGPSNQQFPPSMVPHPSRPAPM